MLRGTTIIWILLTFFLSLIGCSENNATSGGQPIGAKPNCTYNLPKESSFSVLLPTAALGVDFDHKKLTQLMSLPQEQNFCFIQHQGQVSFYKMENDLESSHLFDNLEPAPEKIKNFWQQLIVERETDDLLGLTTTNYLDNGETKRINSTVITLSPAAHSWHLWHEFAHMLIARDRNDHPDKSLRYPTQQDIQKEQTQFIQLTFTEKDPEKLLAAFDILIAHMKDYDTHMFLEEMSIELSLHHYALQASQNPLIFESDIQVSLGSLQDLFALRVRYYKQLTKRLTHEGEFRAELKAPLNKLMLEVDDIQDRMHTLIVYYENAWSARPW